jgi:septum formation protein
VTELRLVLASASPARRRLLEAAGIDARVVVSGVDESMVEASRAETLCVVLARMKAEAVVTRLGTGPAPVFGEAVDVRPGIGPAAYVDGAPEPAERMLVLGCDSVLAFDGVVLGKPADAAEAVQRWRAMRGGKGVLHTGHCLIDPSYDRRVEAAAATTVHFADLDDGEIEAYVASGEPLAVAGAFTIDGLGAPFVTGIEGDAGTVIGLSLPLLRTMLADLDVRISDLWRPRPDSAGHA